MLVFPFAKINLGLNVIRRRTDGFHEIESVLVPIPLYDALEVIVDKESSDGALRYTRSGLAIDGHIDADLCKRAVLLVAREFKLPGLRMHLHKNIPMGAGLGGGSSDAAHVLKVLNELLHLGLGQDQLQVLAAELGSDAPFFMERTACLAEGRGEILRPVPLDLKGLYLHLVHPGIHVSTAEAFKNTSPTHTHNDTAVKLRTEPMERWQQIITNSMERSVFAAHPAIGAMKERMLRAGASYAAMSGSGSSVYGLFRSVPPEMNWPDRYRSWSLLL